MSKTDTKPSAEREQLKLARRLAASAEKRDVIREWLERRDAMRQSRGGELVLPDHTADVAELQARLRVRALVMCEDIMLHSIVEKNQLKAIELVLMMGESAAADAAAAAQAPRIVDAEVPRDEKIRILRALARTG